MHVLVLGLVLSSLLVQSSSVPRKSDRESAGLTSSVRLVRTEIARLSKEGDKWVESSRFAPRVMAYDVEGRLVGAISYGAGNQIISKSVYSYDADGHRIEKRHFGGGDVRLFKEVVKYDSDGNRIEESEYAGDGRVISKTNYKYDDKNRLIETVTDSSDPRSSRCVETYKEKSQLSESVCYDQKGDVFTKSTSEYELDRVGNWIKSVSSTWQMMEGKLTFIGRSAVYRTITYDSPQNQDDIQSVLKDISDKVPSAPTGPKVIRKSGGVLQQEAVRKVSPHYPREAVAARITGTVVVELTIDEEGNVIRAKALSGPIELQSASVAAAREWKFKPTRLSGIPVKVIGTLSFIFQP